MLKSIRMLDELLGRVLNRQSQEINRVRVAIGRNSMKTRHVSECHRTETILSFSLNRCHKTSESNESKRSEGEYPKAVPLIWMNQVTNLFVEAVAPFYADLKC